jgi:hypothetical protein
MRGVKDMDKRYRILHLFADLLDFDGTRGDILYFLSRLKTYDISYEYVAHHVGEQVDVASFDFVYAGVCPQKYESLYLHHLRQDVKGIQTYIERGKPLLAVEQSFLFLGHELITDGMRTPLLGVLPFNVEQLDHYAIGNMLVEMKRTDFDSKINGFINTRYTFILPPSSAFAPFGTVRLGVDFLWERGFEGMQYKNFIGTQLRGPILPRNYDLTDYLIKVMLGVHILPPIDAALEQAAKAQLTTDCEAFIASGEQEKEYIYIS